MGRLKTPRRLPSTARERVVRDLVNRAFTKLVSYNGTQHLDELLSAYGCIGNAIQLIQKEQTS